MSCPAPEKQLFQIKETATVTPGILSQVSYPQKPLQCPEGVQAVSRALVAASSFPSLYKQQILIPHTAATHPHCSLPSYSNPVSTRDHHQPTAPARFQQSSSTGGAQLEDEAQGLFPKAQRSPPACCELSSRRAQPSVRAQSCSHALQSPKVSSDGRGCGALPWLQRRLVGR